MLSEGRRIVSFDCASLNLSRTWAIASSETMRLAPDCRRTSLSGDCPISGFVSCQKCRTGNCRNHRRTGHYSPQELHRSARHSSWRQNTLPQRYRPCSTVSRIARGSARSPWFQILAQRNRCRSMSHQAWMRLARVQAAMRTTSKPKVQLYLFAS